MKKISFQWKYHFFFMSFQYKNLKFNCPLNNPNKFDCPIENPNRVFNDRLINLTEKFNWIFNNRISICFDKWIWNNPNILMFTDIDWTHAHYFNWFSSFGPTNGTKLIGRITNRLIGPPGTKFSTKRNIINLSLLISAN